MALLVLHMWDHQGIFMFLAFRQARTNTEVVLGNSETGRL